LEDAEDLVEHAFYKALRSIPRKDPRSAFNVWLFHIAKNLITDFYRTQKRHELIEDDVSTIDSAEEEALRGQLGGPLSEAVSGLTDRQREVSRLRFLDGLEYPEIAERLGCRAGAVRVAQMRALRALRKSLDGTATQAS
jgi:RNA polymerase sigma-70 factor (ECF subfamily)